MFSRISLAKSVGRTGIVAAVLIVTGLTRSASADIVYDVSTPINGTTPVGTLTAEFDDKSSGVVDLTMTFNNHAGSTGEFISDWGFNVKSTFTDFAHLAISTVSKTIGHYADTAVAGPSDDSQTFNPTSIGKFDVLFKWTGSDHTFIPGGKVVYEFKYTGTQTFDASTFDAVSSGGSVAHAPFYTAAKIAGIPPGGNSGELGNYTGPHTPLKPVPEPSTLALAGLGGLGLISYRWRKRSRAMA
jgi:hypothetical protein